MTDTIDDDDFFAELNKEIAVHMGKTAMRASAADAKKRANNRWVPKEDRDRAEAEWKELNALLEADRWLAVSTVALFTEQKCDGCGSEHRLFLQFMEAQVQKHKSSNKRWVRVSNPDTSLPRETLLHSSKTHICSDCAADHGFDLGQASRLGITGVALTISSNYTQGDINAPSQVN